MTASLTLTRSSKVSSTCRAVAAVAEAAEATTAPAWRRATQPADRHRSGGSWRKPASETTSPSRAGEGPGDFANRRDDIRLVELAAAPLIIFQVDLIVFGRRRVRYDLDAKLAAAEALGGIEIEDEGNQETRAAAPRSPSAGRGSRLPAQLHHKEQICTDADQHIDQQDVLPVGACRSSSPLSRRKAYSSRRV